MKTIIPKTHLFINSNGPGAEGHSLAEALHTTRHGAIAGDPHVFAVDGVETQGGEVVGGATGARSTGCCNEGEENLVMLHIEQKNNFWARVFLEWFDKKKQNE